MGYVKGCELTLLSKYVLKSMDKGKLLMADGLKDQLSSEELKQLFERASANFVNDEGKELKGVQAGVVYAMLKKIDKQKYLIGIAAMKRIDGGPTGKTGVAAWFAESTDTYVMQERFFAPDLPEEEIYFDECVLSNLKDTVSFGQVKEAEYLDKVVIKVEKQQIWGITFTRTAFFLLMLIVWGLIFKNFGLGLCFAFLFLTSFTMITSKTQVKEEVKPQGADELQKT